MASLHNVASAMYNCSVCGDRFGYRMLLMRHMKSAHAQIAAAAGMLPH